VTRLSNLYRLQVIDGQLDALKARLAELDHLLSTHSELDAARAEEGLALQAQNTAREHANQSEEDNRLQLNKIKDTDQALYGGNVRNPKELQDLQNDIASMQKHQTVLEERQLQAMMALEESESASARSHQAVLAIETRRTEQEKTWQLEQAEVRAQLQTMEMQAEAALAAVLPEDLSLYQSLRKSKRGRAVVKMESDSCPGCGVTPSATRLDAARNGQEIVLCGNCGRILYMG
jgi:predicted  nucleic acid-binding Zn-ribbon protein